MVRSPLVPPLVLPRRATTAFVLLCVFTLGWVFGQTGGYPPAHARAAAQLRGLWVDNGSLARLGGRDGVHRLVMLARDAGINALFVESLFRGYTLYPGPYVDPRFAGWGEDPLQVVVDEAHRAGLALHAWMWMLGAGVYGQPGPILNAHPEWADRNRQGDPVSATRSAMPWLDPSRPEVRAWLAEQAVHVATAYGVEGIHLDYIRYSDELSGPFGYSDHARAAFRAETGLPPPGTDPSAEQSSDWQMAWQRWREAQVTGVVAAVSRALSQQAPQVALSAAVLPELSQARLLHLQDWRDWLVNGRIDFVVPMAYTSALPNLQDMLDAIQADLDRAGPWSDPSALRARVAVGLAIFANRPESLAAQLQLVASRGYAGAVLFSSSYLSLPHRRMLAETPFNPPAAPPRRARPTPVEMPWQPPTAPRVAAYPAGLPGPAGLGAAGQQGSAGALVNVAPLARVRVDSAFRGYSAAPLTDGRRNDEPEVGRWAEVAWASAELGQDHWVELAWDHPVVVQQVDLYWAADRGRFFSSGQVRLEVLSDGADQADWETLWSARFEPPTWDVSRTAVTTVPRTIRALRIVQPAGQGPKGRPDLMWLAEIEVYGQPGQEMPAS